MPYGKPIGKQSEMKGKRYFRRVSDRYQVGYGELTDDGGSNIAQRVRQLGAQRRLQLSRAACRMPPQYIL